MIKALKSLPIENRPALLSLVRTAVSNLAGDGYLTLATVSRGRGRKEATVGRLDSGGKREIARFLIERLKQGGPGRYRVRAYTGSNGGAGGRSATFTLNAPVPDPRRPSRAPAPAVTSTSTSPAPERNLQRRVEQLRREGERQREQLTATNRRLQQATTAQHQLEDQLRTTAHERDHAARQYHDARQYQRQCDQEIHRLRSQVQALQRSGSEEHGLRKTIEDLRADLTRAISERTEEANRADADRRRQQKKMLALQRKNEDLRRHNRALRNRAADLESRLVDATTRLNNLAVAADEDDDEEEESGGYYFVDLGDEDGEDSW